MVGGIGSEERYDNRPGLNYSHTSRFALRRLVDGGPVSEIEFAAEMTGFMELVRLLRRRLRAGRGMTARWRVYRNQEGRPSSTHTESRS
jgi:hypothetical protein